jgi:hypothetical protein
VIEDAHVDALQNVDKALRTSDAIWSLGVF